MVRAAVVITLLTLLTPAAGSTDPLWITYSNGTLGFFAIYGPERMMRFHPPDFQLDYPFQIESLATRFYGGMGSWRDSVFLFKIYGNDGRTLLFESESLIAPRSLNFRYGLRAPIGIDSGDFYAGLALRYESLGFAYPFLTTDDNLSAAHSLYGTAGNWQSWTTGEYFISAFVRYTGVGTSEPGLSTQKSRLAARSGSSRWILLDAAGRQIQRLKYLEQCPWGLPAGVYFICRDPAADGEEPLQAKVVVIR